MLFIKSEVSSGCGKKDKKVEGMDEVKDRAEKTIRQYLIILQKFLLRENCNNYLSFLIMFCLFFTVLHGFYV